MNEAILKTIRVPLCIHTRYIIRMSASQITILREKRPFGHSHDEYEENEDDGDNDGSCDVSASLTPALQRVLPLP
jgi:hypothetical protein